MIGEAIVRLLEELLIKTPIKQDKEYLRVLLILDCDFNRPDKQARMIVKPRTSHLLVTGILLDALRAVAPKGLPTGAITPKGLEKDKPSYVA
jgi:hypothetical protein